VVDISFLTLETKNKQ